MTMAAARMVSTAQWGSEALVDELVLRRTTVPGGSWLLSRGACRLMLVLLSVTLVVFSPCDHAVLSYSA